MAEKRGRGAPKGPRPHIRKYPNERDNKMYYAFLKMRAQAKFRGELFSLTFEDFQDLWGDKFEQRGKQSHCLVLTKIDRRFTWSRDNVHLITRQEQLIRDGESKRRRHRHVV